MAGIPQPFPSGQMQSHLSLFELQAGVNRQLARAAGQSLLGLGTPHSRVVSPCPVGQHVVLRECNTSRLLSTVAMIVISISLISHTM